MIFISFLECKQQNKLEIGFVIYYFLRHIGRRVLTLQIIFLGNCFSRKIIFCEAKKSGL